ncbi:MAG TPA: hypothetical protein VHB23_03415 [Devosiaceae bacterium]|nr:hypothetical protein [Devosiaceae bacterium]
MISLLARRFQQLPASGVVTVEPGVELLLKPVGLSSRLEALGLNRRRPSWMQVPAVLTQAVHHCRCVIECVSDRMFKWQVERQTTIDSTKRLKGFRRLLHRRYVPGRGLERAVRPSERSRTVLEQ